MSSTHVVYDNQYGRIISIQHGQIDTTPTRQLADLYVRAEHYYAGVNLSQRQAFVFGVALDIFLQRLVINEAPRLIQALAWANAYDRCGIDLEAVRTHA